MIGVFDSGFGGLVVLREFLRVLPDYDYLYLGDNARIPYGTRSDRVVQRFTEQAVDYLFRQGCQLIVLACHTASAGPCGASRWFIYHSTTPTAGFLGC